MYKKLETIVASVSIFSFWIILQLLKMIQMHYLCWELSNNTKFPYIPTKILVDWIFTYKIFSRTKSFRRSKYSDIISLTFLRELSNVTAGMLVLSLLPVTWSDLPTYPTWPHSMPDTCRTQSLFAINRRPRPSDLKGDGRSLHQSCFSPTATPSSSAVIPLFVRVEEEEKKCGRTDRPHGLRILHLFFE